MEKDLSFIGDNPIRKIEEDLFNFEHYAVKVQKLLQYNSNNSNPLTIGVYGKWGEGKTSFLNLIENKIDLWKKGNKDKGILKYHFNPWRYSTEDEMLFDFFDGLAKSMFVGGDSNLNKVGKGILKFSKYLKAVKISASVGISPSNKITTTVEPSEIFKVLGEGFEGKDITLDKLKEEINIALKIASYKIIVFIDDIDRLDKKEIYTILKLIKLNGSFDNFVYIATMDSEQVAKAISKRYGSKKNDGKLFLEKIINIPIHLPRIEDADLKNFFDRKIIELAKGLEFFDQENKNSELQDIRNSFSSENFETPREIIRVCNSFFVGAFAIGEEVNLYDLFWIEYLKIKYPKTYESIKNYSHSNSIMTSFQEILDFNDNQLDNTIHHGKRQELLSLDAKAFNIIERLFPLEIKTGTMMAKPFDKEKMKKELRVNTLDNYDKYFSYHTIRKISNLEISKLKKNIKDIDSDKIKETISVIKTQAGNQLHRVFYIFEQLSKDLKIEEGKHLWFEFIFDNLNLIPKVGKDIFGLDYDLRLIEIISKELNNEDNNTDLVLDLAKKLDKDQLCHFTRKFNEEKIFKEELEKLVISKLKDEDYINKPFYLDSQKSSNRFIMHYWKKHFPKEYENFLKETINSDERLATILRGFVAYWNNTFYGNLSIEGYKSVKRLLYKELIYTKIKKYYNNLLIEYVENDDVSFSDHDEKTVEENIKQFLNHYSIDEEI